MNYEGDNPVLRYFAIVRPQLWEAADFEKVAYVLSHVTRLGYIHEIVRPDAGVGENLLPHCNRIASLLQRWLLGTHQGAVSHEHLGYYLDEYTLG